MSFDFSIWDRNCVEDQPTPSEANVTGSIPAWLRGSYILNGCGKMRFKDVEYRHAFDGMAILQKISFEETGVTYCSRFLQSDAYQLNTAADTIVMNEFATRAVSTIEKNTFQKIGDMFNFGKNISDNTSVNIVRYGDAYFAVSESPFLHQININTLETVRKVDLHKLIGVTSICPHPYITKDGSIVTIFNAVGATGPRYDLVSFKKNFTFTKVGENEMNKPKRLCSLDARWKLNPCYMHSFGMTEKHLILVEQPLTIDVRTMVVNSFKGKPLLDGLDWRGEKQTKIHVISLETGKEVTKTSYKCPPFFFAHIINCYDEGNFTIVDIDTFNKPDFLYQMYLEKIRSPNFGKNFDKGEVKRLVIPLVLSGKESPDQNLVTVAGSNAKAFRKENGKVEMMPEILNDFVYEIPSMNPKFVSKKYNYFYGISGDLSEMYGTIGKVNIESKTSLVWKKHNVFSTLCQFVSRPGATAEDDGVVLVFALIGGSDEESKRKIYIAVLDAFTMEEVAAVHITTKSEATRPNHCIYIPN